MSANGWEKKPLGDLGRLYCGQSPATADVNRDGVGTPYVTGPEQWDGNTVHRTKWTTTPKRLVPDGCIFITVKGAGVGKLFPGIACAIGRDVYAFEPDESVDNRFVEHALRFTIDDIVRQARGDIPGLSKRQILDHDIGVPPLPEQRRIVNRIEELFSRLDAGVAALRHAKAQLQRYRQSVLAAAVTGQLTQAWREQHPDTEPAEELLERILKQRREQWSGKGKYKEPVTLEMGDVEATPTTWATTNLDSATTILGDGLHGTPEYDPEGEFYFINGNNLSNGKIIFKDSTKRVSESEFQKHRKPLTQNSIFVSINGTLGNTAFYSGEKVILGKSACFFNLSPQLSKRYVRTVLQTNRFLNYLHKTATGSTIKNVPLKAMRNFSFGIPSLAEQKQIVAEVEARTTAIDHLEAELDRQITRSNRLRQSTLSSAFSGNL